jgi:glycosyltransferase involved in cell wall biosynthesis
MIVSIDCRLINASGVGVYLRGCLPYFFQSKNNFLLIGDPNNLQSYKSFLNVKIINCNVKTFSITELFFFPTVVKKEINNSNFFFSPFFNIPCGINIPVFITIHDIIFPDLPELSSKIGLAIRMWFFRRAHKKSKKIFTVSQFSKSRIEHHLGLNKPVIVTYSAIQQKFLDYRANTQNIKKKETIIFIGNIKKHKGLSYLLDAFIIAKKEGLPHKLIIIGNKDDFRSRDSTILSKIESIGNNSVKFTGFASDETLMEHLSSASLLVQPSLYEGFCLPPLEAMVLGTHALISDIPVLKEIYSDYPVTFFEAGESVELKEKFLNLLYNKPAPVVNLTEYLISKYTFEKTASTILDNLEY